MDENQEFRQEEINLMDLIFYCLEKWRWIVAFMLILAVAAGAYKYRGVVKENQASCHLDISDFLRGKKPANGWLLEGFSQI